MNRSRRLSLWTLSLAQISTNSWVLIFILAGLALGFTTASTQTTDRLSLVRISLMPSTYQDSLLTNLEEFDRLPEPRQREILYLHERMMSRPEPKRSRDLSKIRNYDSWIESVDPNVRRMILAEPDLDQRMDQILALLAQDEGILRVEELERVETWTERYGPYSPIRIARALTTWYSWDKPRRTFYESRFQSTESLLEFLEIRGVQEGWLDPVPIAIQQIQQSYQVKSNAIAFNRMLDLPPIQQYIQGERSIRDIARELPIENRLTVLEGLARRSGLSRDLVLSRLKLLNDLMILKQIELFPVRTDELERLDRAIPNWIRSNFDRLSPDDLSELLTMIYRQLAPEGKLSETWPNDQRQELKDRGRRIGPTRLETDRQFDRGMVPSPSDRRDQDRTNSPAERRLPEERRSVTLSHSSPRE